MSTQTIPEATNLGIPTPAELNLINPAATTPAAISLVSCGGVCSVKVETTGNFRYSWA